MIGLGGAGGHRRGGASNRHSVPVLHVLGGDGGMSVKCPVCQRDLTALEGGEDPETHLVMCLTRPRLAYNGEWLNGQWGGGLGGVGWFSGFKILKIKITTQFPEDILGTDREEECAICLEEMLKGDCIARLPCLCVYHKK